MATRKAADKRWHERQQELAARASGLATTTRWLAFMVIIDNCTRYSVALPVFASGAHVTAEEVLAELRKLLPPHLQYLISDRGCHFTAGIFEQYLREQEVVHVLTARHRPQSNGIAERFVRTIKEWLADKAWTTEQELVRLLEEFGAYYNERPHQGSS